LISSSCWRDTREKERERGGGREGEREFGKYGKIWIIEEGVEVSHFLFLF